MVCVDEIASQNARRAAEVGFGISSAFFRFACICDAHSGPNPQASNLYLMSLGSHLRMQQFHRRKHGSRADEVEKV